MATRKLVRCSMDIKQFTKEDFMNSLEPYEFLYAHKDNSFILEKMLTAISEMAQQQGIRNFKKLFTEYVKSQKANSKVIHVNNVVNFEGLDKKIPIELDAGDWRADDQGITTDGMYGEIVACVHPISPIERLVNIDTGIEKLKLAFRRTKNWRTIIVDKKTLASSNLILSLADSGIAVNSENSKYLIKFLHDIEHLNYEIIPEKNSVSRLGWIDGEGFAPYVENLVFDGDVNFKNYFESVKPTGSFEAWKKAVKEARQKNIINRIMLASSFASALVRPIGGLTFMTHIWGGTEAGKTVALMMAASVWANPELGKYIQSFNSTAVGRERLAAFFNNLPLILDELQVIKDKKQFDQDIYMLCEGTGKVRGNKTGGADQTPIWANCIISSGEMPITNANSGGGAVNRILDIECKESLFSNPREFCSSIKKNYGHAGRAFIEFISEEGRMDEVLLTFKSYHALLSGRDATEKQALSGALLLTADYYVTSLFFDNEDELKIEDIQPFLQTKKAVNANERGYEFLCSWVSQNVNHFRSVNDMSQVYGVIEDDYAYIINTAYQKACEEGGYNATALLSYLKSNNLIESTKTHSMKLKRINGIVTRCLCLKMLDESIIVFQE